MILYDLIKGNCRHPLFSIRFYHHCRSFATVILRVHPTSKQPSSHFVMAWFHIAIEISITGQQATGKGTEKRAGLAQQHSDGRIPQNLPMEVQITLKFLHADIIFYREIYWVVCSLLQENPMSRCSQRRGCFPQKAARASKLPTVWT